MPRHSDRPVEGAAAWAIGAAIWEAMDRYSVTPKLLSELTGIRSSTLRKSTRGQQVPTSENFESILNCERWKNDKDVRRILKVGQLRSRIGTESGPSKLPAPKPSGSARDLVGLGALNYDDVALTGLPAKGAFDDSDDSEKVVDTQEEYIDLIKRLETDHGVTRFSHQLGGSSFNTVRLIAEAGFGTGGWGFVGISGQVPGSIDVLDGYPSPLSHREALEDHDVSGLGVQHMKPSRTLGGRCLSVMVGKQRRMRTWQGANVELCDHLLGAFDEIASYLTGARHIHVTSVIDEQAGRLISGLLEYVASHSPRTRISFDPGPIWCNRKLEYVGRILKLTDILFVSESEARNLQANYCEASETSAALDVEDEVPELLRECLQPRGAVAVVKRTGATSIYTAEDSQHFPTQKVRHIVDDTGAGDVFGAGFLSLLVSEQAIYPIAAQVGMQLARLKLERVGRPSGDELKDLVNRIRVPRVEIN